MEQYVPIIIFSLVALSFPIITFIIAKVVRAGAPDPVKSTPYECGIDPVGGGWSQTHVRYYIFALLFLVFDVEAVFIFPWAVQLESLGMFALVEMGIFIAILLSGLVYAIRKGVLRWES